MLRQGRAFLFSTDLIAFGYDLDEDSFLEELSDLDELSDFEGLSDLEELSVLEELSDLEGLSDFEELSDLDELSDFGAVAPSVDSFFFPVSGFLSSVDFIFCE